MRKPLLVSLPAILALALVPARASTVQYNLTVDQCTGSCGPTNTIFGTITLTDTVANTVEVNVSLNSPYQFIHTGFPVTFAWSLSGDPTIVVDGLPADWSLLSPTAGSLHMTGTDYFDYGVSCCSNQNGASHAQPGPISFTLSGSGVSTSSFQGTAANHFFAVDIYNADTSFVGGGNTGVVEAPGSPFGIADNPEPGSFALLGGGLVAFGWMLRRKAKPKLRRG